MSLLIGGPCSFLFLDSLRFHDSSTCLPVDGLLFQQLLSPSCAMLAPPIGVSSSWWCAAAALAVGGSLALTLQFALQNAHLTAPERSAAAQRQRPFCVSSMRLGRYARSGRVLEVTLYIVISFSGLGLDVTAGTRRSQACAPLLVHCTSPEVHIPKSSRALDPQKKCKSARVRATRLSALVL
jgi:hypothetical protein